MRRRERRRRPPSPSVDLERFQGSKVSSVSEIEGERTLGR